MNTVLTYINAVKEKTQEIENIVTDLKNYCKNKKFRIVKNIYHNGYKTNLIGRVCYIEPFYTGRQLLFSCKVYNKTRKQINIDHRYGHDMSYYEEL